MLCLSDSIGKKAYTCQKCSVSRDEEEIKKMRSEILQLSDKASSFLSSGSILVYD
jgi:SET and MYND domain-containing protein